jgi:hypothetical protein
MADRLPRRFSKEIAKLLLEHYGAFAYIHAIELMDADPMDKTMWEDALHELDKLMKEETL